MPEPVGGSRAIGRGKRWQVGTTALLGQLTDDQKVALRRARAGFPPDFILGPIDQSGAGMALALSLNSIETIARELLRGYEWPVADDPQAWPPSGFLDVLGTGEWRAVGPDWAPDPAQSQLRYDQGADRVCPRYDAQDRPIEGRPDLRFESLTLVQLAAEIRAALAEGQVDGALLRVMTIGTLFGRVASMLFDGPSIARGAVNTILKHRTHESLRENQQKRNSERTAEILRLDGLLLGWKEKSRRAEYIKRGWDVHIGLDKWVATYNRNRDPKAHVRTLSVDEISRHLPTR